MDARATVDRGKLWVGWENSCTDPQAGELRAEFEKLVKKRGFRYEDEQRIAGAANLMQRMYEDVANRNDGAKPIVHILRVALRVLSYGTKDPDVVIAALLHDAIEDHPEAFARLGNRRDEGGGDEKSDREDALAYIKQQCNGEVSEIIRHTTRVKPGGYENLTAEEKLRDYLVYIKNVTRFPKVFIVKAADNTDNVFYPSPDKEQRRYSMHKYARSTEVLLEEMPGLRWDLMKIGGPLLYVKVWAQLKNANKQAKSWEKLDAPA